MLLQIGQISSRIYARKVVVMKKIIILLCFFQLTNNFVFSAIQSPEYDNIITEDAKYNYMEPIQRPKWKKPLAWVGYAGTLFMVPFPLIMSANDAKIEKNNQKYERYIKMKEDFNNEIAQCNAVFKNDKDLYYCYQNVKKQFITLSGNQSTEYNNAEQLKIQRQQLYQMYQMSRPHYSHSTTTTPYGETYHTNTYSY
jgi:hypothetical protein